jgi:hypothetical protein
MDSIGKLIQAFVSVATARQAWHTTDTDRSPSSHPVIGAETKARQKPPQPKKGSTKQAEKDKLQQDAYPWW